jgi:hypothetical protein
MRGSHGHVDGFVPGQFLHRSHIRASHNQPHDGRVLRLLKRLTATPSLAGQQHGRANLRRERRPAEQFIGSPQRHENTSYYSVDVIDDDAAVLKQSSHLVVIGLSGYHQTRGVFR